MHKSWLAIIVAYCSISGMDTEKFKKIQDSNEYLDITQTETLFRSSFKKQIEYQIKNNMAYILAVVKTKQAISKTNTTNIYRLHYYNATILTQHLFRHMHNFDNIAQQKLTNPNSQTQIHGKICYFTINGTVKNNTVFIDNQFNYLGNHYELSKKHKRYFLKNFFRANQDDDKNKQASGQYKVGSYYLNLNPRQLSKAITYLSLAATQHHNPKIQVQAQFNQGHAYLFSKNMAQAKKILTSSAQQQNDEGIAAMANYSLATHFYTPQNRNSNGKEQYLRQAANQNKNKRIKTYASFLLEDLLVEQKKFSEARQYLSFVVKQDSIPSVQTKAASLLDLMRN